MVDVSISTKKEIEHLLKKMGMTLSVYADPGDVVYKWEKKGSINGQLSYKLKSGWRKSREDFSEDVTLASLESTVSMGVEFPIGMSMGAEITTRLENTVTRSTEITDEKTNDTSFDV